MVRINKLFIVFVLFLLAFSSVAQEGRPLRVEIESKILSDDFHVIPAGQDGIIILFNEPERSENDEWTILNYDSQLNERWSKSLRFDRPYHYQDSDIDKHISHSLFISRFGSGREIRIISHDFNSDSLHQRDFVLPANMEAQYFFVVDNKAFILGYSAPKRKIGLLFSGTRYLPVMFSIDLITSELLDLSPPDKSHHELISSSLSETTGNVNVLLRDIKQRKRNKLILQVYSSDGKLLSESDILAGKDFQFVDAEVIQASDQDVIVLGTYSRSGKTNTGFAEGIFMSLVTGYTQAYVKFYPFTDFDTFGKTVSSRTMRRVVKKKSKGKDVTVGFRMLIHNEIDIIDGNFIVQAEAYHPEYRTEYRYDPFYGYGSTVQVFEGWRFDHALLASFNRDGELLWDQAMQMHNILEANNNLREHVLLLEDADDLITVYSYDGSLYSMVLNNGEVVEGREKTNLETGKRDDKVRANYRSELDFWYGSYMLAWGYQKIKTGSRKREVFFMNKIAFK